MGAEVGSNRPSPATASSTVDRDETDILVDLSSVHQQQLDVEERIGSLRDDLDRAADEEETTLRELELVRSRQHDLVSELRQRQVEASRLALQEASGAQRVLIAEAERRAAKITEKASADTARLLAEAKERATEIVEAGRAKLEAFEAEVTARAAKLESERQALDRRAAALRGHHDQMVETLKLLAELALEQVAETQQSAQYLFAAAGSRSSQSATEPGSRAGG